MQTKTVKELAIRLNEIMVEENKLTTQMNALIEEHDAIVYELWDRIPSLKGDPSLELKRVKKK